jgi:predicted alpha/beta hydrolase family esterase
MANLLRDFDHLILPCRDNASPDHWQSHWQAALPNMARVTNGCRPGWTPG